MTGSIEGDNLLSRELREAEITKLTRMLCAVMRSVEALHPDGLFAPESEIMQWWPEHKRKDDHWQMGCLFERVWDMSAGGYAPAGWMMCPECRLTLLIPATGIPKQRVKRDATAPR